jgi:hypothetical protein
MLLCCMLLCVMCICSLYMAFVRVQDRIGSGGEPLCMVRRPRGRRPPHLGGQVDWQVVPLDPLSPGSNLGSVFEASQALLFALRLRVAGNRLVASAPHNFGLPIFWSRWWYYD